MPIITLTSDLGFLDPHVPATKGYLQGQLPHYQIVDISHEIPAFFYTKAAFILKNSFRSFPKGSIHIVAVEGDFVKPVQFVAAFLDGHYFITKNTGLISMLSDNKPDWAVGLEIPNAEALKCPIKDILAPVAIKIAQETPINQLGKSIELVQKKFRDPVLKPDTIIGNIIHFTHHQNAVTNIHRKHFKKYTDFNSCKIHYGRNGYFDKIYNSYHDVVEGETCCFFGMDMLLEFGIHGGKGKSLLSLSEDRNIWIEFYNK